MGLSQGNARFLDIKYMAILLELRFRYYYIITSKYYTNYSLVFPATDIDVSVHRSPRRGSGG